MSVNKGIDFFFENYYKWIELFNGNSYYSMKLLKRYWLLLANKLMVKIPDSRNDKEQYQTFLRKKNTKSVKQSEYWTSHKLSKTKVQNEK